MEGLAGAVLIAAIAAWLMQRAYLEHQAKQKRLELIHQERLAAMDKGIPLPELPVDPPPAPAAPDPHALPIMSIMLIAISVGAMVVLYVNLPAPAHAFWISPLPLLFWGVGMLLYQLLVIKTKQD